MDWRISQRIVVIFVSALVSWGVGMLMAQQQGPSSEEQLARCQGESFSLASAVNGAKSATGELNAQLYKEQLAHTQTKQQLTNAQEQAKTLQEQLDAAKKAKE